MIAAALLLPTVLALFGALGPSHEPWAALAPILSVVGAAVYLAGNTALPMFALSKQYAAAATEANGPRSWRPAQAMLALGESHTPGTFVAFLLLQSGALLNSGLMLRSEHFARATAVTGLLGAPYCSPLSSCQTSFRLFSRCHCSSRSPGACSSLVWYVLVGSRPSSSWRGSPRPALSLVAKPTQLPALATLG